MVWETVPTNYCFIFSLSKVGFSFLPSLISTTRFVCLWNEEVKYEANHYHHVAEACSFEMVYDITLIYQQTVCFFTADLASWFHSKLQSVAVMMSSVKRLLEDEMEQSLLEELTASDQSSSSDDDDSNGTDDLTVGEVIGSEYSEEESDNVQ